MADLQLKGVSKTYPGNIRAVAPTSVEIEDGEFAILVGPSGCGKSTLLRMIAGLETISEGEIHIGGRLVNNVPAKDRDIAMVFQNYALYPHMTVYENMAFGLKMRKLPKSEIDDRVRRAFADAAARGAPNPTLLRILARHPIALHAFYEGWQNTFYGGIVEHPLKELMRVRMARLRNCGY